MGYRPETPPYVALVGGDDWATELNTQEWISFCHLLPSLLSTIEGVRQELSDEENFTCRMDSDCLCLEAMGYPQKWQLRLELRSGRQVEGFWHSPAMYDLWQNIQLIA